MDTRVYREAMDLEDFLEQAGFPDYKATVSILLQRILDLEKIIGPDFPEVDSDKTEEIEIDVDKSRADFQSKMDIRTRHAEHDKLRAFSQTLWEHGVRLDDLEAANMVAGKQATGWWKTW